jgi:hypothetical protein
MRLLVLVGVLALGVWATWPYVAHYLTLWLHTGTTGLVTIGVFVFYAALLVRFAAARRVALFVLNLASLGIVGTALSRLGRT